MGEQAIKMALWIICLHGGLVCTTNITPVKWVKYLGLGLKNLKNDLNLYTTFSNALHLY